MKRFLYLAAFTSVLALPSISGAELTGEATIGASFTDVNNRESFKYGEYTGVTDDGIRMLGSADVGYYRDAYFLELDARDLGLDNRSVLLRSGRLNGYEAFISYSETPRLISNNSRTPFTNPGSSNLTLPAGFVKADNTTLMTNLTASRRDVELRLDREEWRFGFSRQLGRDYALSIDYRHEEKEGLKSIGGTLGISGGNTRSIVLPEPVDYKTDEIRAAVSYAGNSANARAEYLVSFFDNNNESIIWESPIIRAGYPGTARTSLPPDNLHQRLSLSGGVNLPFYSTRVNAAAEYGIMEQDEELFPYSINPASTITVPLPRDSAQAEMIVKGLTLNVASRPAPKLGLNLRYKYYSTDNGTPRQLFRYVKNDQGAAQAAITEAHALYNLPYDYTQNKLSFDGSYHLFRATSLKAGYDYESIERGFREVQETRENAYRAALTSGYFEDLQLGLTGSYAERRGEDQYDQSKLYDEAHTPEFIATLDADERFDNHPLARKFDIADRNMTKLGASASWSPLPEVSVSAFYDYQENDFENSELGMTKRDSHRYTADIAWSPVPSASVYAFYTLEFVDTEQKSWSFSGSTTGSPSSKQSQSTDLDRRWSVNHDERIDTIGAGMKLAFMDDKLTVDADYSYSEGSTNTGFNAGADLAVPKDLPALKTRLHSLNVTGRYRLVSSLSLGAGYSFERYESDDWQTDNFEPASSTITNVITLSGPVEDYEAHQATVFVTYHFGG